MCSDIVGFCNKVSSLPALYLPVKIGFNFFGRMSFAWRSENITLDARYCPKCIHSMALKCGHAVQLHSIVQTHYQPQRHGLPADAPVPYMTSTFSSLSDKPAQISSTAQLGCKTYTTFSASLEVP